jgi:hypothetical protein
MAASTLDPLGELYSSDGFADYLSVCQWPFSRLAGQWATTCHSSWLESRVIIHLLGKSICSLSDSVLARSLGRTRHVVISVGLSASRITDYFFANGTANKTFHGVFPELLKKARFFEGLQHLVLLRRIQ